MGNLKSIIKRQRKKLPLILTFILLAVPLMMIIAIFLVAQSDCVDPVSIVSSDYCIYPYHPDNNETCAKLASAYVECIVNKETTLMMTKNILIISLFMLLLRLAIHFKGANRRGNDNAK